MKIGRLRASGSLRLVNRHSVPVDSYANGRGTFQFGNNLGKPTEYFADCSAFVCRPQCLQAGYGHLPFRWMGRSVHPLKQWGGLDVDYRWQVGQVEYWLREHGFTEHSTPYAVAVSE